MNNQPVPVFTSEINGFQTSMVNARELHSYLGIGKFFANWIKGRIQEYGFVEKSDFLPISAKNKSGRGRPTTEYHITLDMAKELAMVERNEKGREARQYFIECERRLKQQTNALPASTPKQATYDPNEFYLIHKSALQAGGAAIAYLHESRGLVTRPIERSAIPMISAAQAFVQQIQTDGFIVMKPDELVKKLTA